MLIVFVVLLMLLPVALFCFETVKWVINVIIIFITINSIAGVCCISVFAVVE